MVSSAETTAEPESEVMSAQQDENACQNPGNLLILLKPVDSSQVCACTEILHHVTENIVEPVLYSYKSLY